MKAGCQIAEAYGTGPDVDDYSSDSVSEKPLTSLEDYGFIQSKPMEHLKQSPITTLRDCLESNSGHHPIHISEEVKEVQTMLEARFAELQEQMGQARAAHKAEMQGYLAFWGAWAALAAVLLATGVVALVSCRLWQKLRAAQEANAMLLARIAELQEQMDQARAAHEAATQESNTRKAELQSSLDSAMQQKAQLQEDTAAACRQ